MVKVENHSDSGNLPDAHAGYRLSDTLLAFVWQQFELLVGQLSLWSHIRQYFLYFINWHVWNAISLGLGRLLPTDRRLNTALHNFMGRYSDGCSVSGLQYVCLFGALVHERGGSGDANAYYTGSYASGIF